MPLDPRLIAPVRIDNCFRGHPLALWLFGGVTVLTLWRSQHHLFAADGGAQSIAQIPLDTYADAAAGAVIGVFALWGLSQLIVGLVYLLALVRYRALIPALCVLMIVEYALRFWVLWAKPIETLGTAPGAVINLPMIALGVVMLGLSCWRRPDAQAQG